MGILIDGKRCALQNQPFLHLLRVVVARLRQGRGWIDREIVGLKKRSYLPGRLAKETRDALPEGMPLVEGGRGGQCRLHPLIEVEVDWEKLADHPIAIVRKIAREEKERTERR